MPNILPSADNDQCAKVDRNFSDYTWQFIFNRIDTLKSRSPHLDYFILPNDFKGLHYNSGKVSFKGLGNLHNTVISSFL
jgi:hypothetical protein